MKGFITWQYVLLNCPLIKISLHSDVPHHLRHFSLYPQRQYLCWATQHKYIAIWLQKETAKLEKKMQDFEKMKGM